jgi:hypothetical protein
LGPQLQCTTAAHSASPCIRSYIASCPARMDACNIGRCGTEPHDLAGGRLDPLQLVKRKGAESLTARFVKCVGLFSRAPQHNQQIPRMSTLTPSPHASSTHAHGLEDAFPPSPTPHSELTLRQPPPRPPPVLAGKHQRPFPPAAHNTTSHITRQTVRHRAGCEPTARLLLTPGHSRYKPPRHMQTTTKAHTYGPLTTPPTPQTHANTNTNTHRHTKVQTPPRHLHPPHSMCEHTPTHLHPVRHYIPLRLLFQRWSTTVATHISITSHPDPCTRTRPATSRSPHPHHHPTPLRTATHLAHIPNTTSRYLPFESHHHARPSPGCTGPEAIPLALSAAAHNITQATPRPMSDPQHRASPRPAPC